MAANDPVYLQATAACLSAIIVMQIVNVFLCRSATRSVLSTGLLGNPLIILGVISEITVLLLISYTPWGNSLLGTAPVGEKVWGSSFLSRWACCCWRSCASGFSARALGVIRRAFSRDELSRSFAA